MAKEHVMSSPQPFNILVAGIYWSGSSAVIDYLKGHLQVSGPGGEFTEFKSVGRIGYMLTMTLPLIIAAKGHGSRQMCRMDKYGFPRTTAKALRSVHGFKTGDIMTALVPAGKKTGVTIQPS